MIGSQPKLVQENRFVAFAGYAAVSGAATAVADAGQELRYSSRVVPQLIRYTVVGIFCLAIDFGCYLSLCAFALKPAVAGTASYLIGMLFNYVLSSRLVFNAPQGSEPSRSRLLGFFATGVLGSALTSATIIISTDFLGASAVNAKIMAVLISFVVVFASRRAFVFSS